jgi:hypothetical protein
VAHIIARSAKIQQLTFDKLRKSSVRALSLDADVSYETLRAVMNGGAVGAPMVADLIEYFGAGFDDLFEIVGNDDPVAVGR